MKKAKKLGYTIIIIEAVEFNKGKPFIKFVDYFYNIKNNTKNKVEKTISKLILNSLYGKTAQKPITNVTKILSDNNDI